MSTHGPEALRLVANALTAASFLTPRPVVLHLTSLAIDVTADAMDLDSAVATFAYRWDVTDYEARTYLEVALEGLNPPTTQE